MLTTEDESRWESILPLVQTLQSAGYEIRREVALQPETDYCYLPYSLDDCCTQSHLKAIKTFAGNETLENTWLLVLEDDVKANPRVNMASITEHAQNIIDQAETLTDFVYLGVCTSPTQASRCARDSRTLQRAVLPSTPTIDKCESMHIRRCTHAYALKHSLAVRLPDMVMSADAQTIDDAFEQLAKQGLLNSYVADVGMTSPQLRGHIGLFYQDQKTFGKDSLTLLFDHNKKVIVLQPQFTGRLGNLMFQWAHAVSFSIELSKHISAKIVLHIDHLEDSIECPLATFVEMFRLRRYVRIANAPNQNFNDETCVVRVQERGANVFDTDFLRKATAEIEARKWCTTIVLNMVGYFQSFKYFSSALVERQVHGSFEFRPEHHDAKLKFLNSIHSDDQIYRIGIQVRLGDKEHDSRFKSIYAPHNWEYYMAAIEHIKKVRSDKFIAKRIQLLVSVGGSLHDGDKKRDQQFVKNFFAKNFSGDFIFVDTDQTVDMLILSSCDAVIIGASSYGWWVAHLSKLPGELIVVPKHIIRPDHELVGQFDIQDYYPEHWTILDNLV